MISPWQDPSRKPPNALRGLRRKMAHFIPSAGVHTKGSYNSTTTRLRIGSTPDYAPCTWYPPDAQRATTVRATSQRLRHFWPGPPCTILGLGRGGRQGLVSPSK